MKTCARCKEEKPVSEFNKHPVNVGFYQSYCRPCKNEITKTNALARRKKVLDVMGGKCVRCGFDDWRALQIDHVNGGGSAEFKSNGSRAAYKKAAAGDPDYQLLCANCNWIKRYENNEATGKYGFVIQ